MKEKIKIYIAGPMFTEGDIAARKRDRIRLEEKLKEDGTFESVEIYNPIEAPFNDKSTLPTAEAIYRGDKEELLSSDLVYAVLDGEDAGVMAEIGMTVGRNISVVGALTDMRVGTAGEYDGVRVPYGYNQFIIGLLLDESHSVHDNTEDALDFVVEQVNYLM